MSAPAVAERVQLDLSVVDGDHACPLEVRIPEIARETPAVVECYRITGEDCYLMKLHLRSSDELEETLDSFTPHRQRTKSIIHSAPVARRGPALGGSS